MPLAVISARVSLVTGMRLYSSSNLSVFSLLKAKSRNDLTCSWWPFFLNAIIQSATPSVDFSGPALPGIGATA